MKFEPVTDPEADALRDEIASRAGGIDADGLDTANLWMWTFEPTEEQPQTIITSLLEHPDLPGREWLQSYWNTQLWTAQTPAIGKPHVLQLLMWGQSLEIPAYPEQPEQATEFLNRLLNWIGSEAILFGSMEYLSETMKGGFSLYCVPRWFDEGFVFLGKNRIAMLWFFGTD